MTLGFSMPSVIFYLFCYATWTIGLLSWLVFFSKKLKDWEIVQEVMMLELENEATTNNPSRRLSNVPNKDSVVPMSPDISEKIKSLMSSSPTHPEVSEIDGSDLILGVRFEAENYPPSFADDD